MKKVFILISLAFLGLPAFSQMPANPPTKDDGIKTYRYTPEKVNDLVHTRLDVKFDYTKSYLFGKAWITLQPHFYSTDSLVLDAQGMDIHRLALLSNGKMKDLNFDYNDSLKLRIKLDKIYKKGEKYTVYIDYTSKPDEIKAGGSRAITQAKGLYFINPQGKEKDKPIQIWTQGETQASSVWFPTIDHTNQKTTQEINMTVPAKYVTLSNGVMVSQKKNADGTRTDSWKMDLPHSPYLFFMGVGDFAIVKDQYKGKEVSYYVEKEFKDVARNIFGNTPEMMQFFSKILGVEYPWGKYSQMVGRDYVSGAMENTTATLHREALQQNARELVDGNEFEDYISHELFHQWFGDYVTAESWSNLTVNESFANFGEILWQAYKHGQDAADALNYRDMLIYLRSGGQNKELVRFHYRDQEQMFDQVSYEKGGRILNMLRHFVGDSAFFNSLNLYLTRYKFGNAEAHQLRLIFEEVTGKDLTWFWNQWYYGNGHPKLDITYGYNDSLKQASVIVEQKTDKNFILPTNIDVYIGTQKTRYPVWIQEKSDTFYFPASEKPSLINFDGDKILLAEKKENKTMDDYINQYLYAGKYVDRREAIDFAAKNYEDIAAKRFLMQALNDRYFELRERAIRNLKVADLDAQAIKRIENIATNDPHRTTRSYAIDVLSELKNPAYVPLFEKGILDSSYSVAGSSLLALAELDEKRALSMLPAIKKDLKGRLERAYEQVNILTKGDADFEEMTQHFDETTGFKKLIDYPLYLTFLGNVNDTTNFKKGIDKVVALRNQMAAFNPRYKAVINEQLLELKKKKLAKKDASNAAAIESQMAYLDEVTKD